MILEMILEMILKVILEIILEMIFVSFVNIMSSTDPNLIKPLKK